MDILLIWIVGEEALEKGDQEVPLHQSLAKALLRPKWFDEEGKGVEKGFEIRKRET